MSSTINKIKRDMWNNVRSRLEAGADPAKLSDQVINDVLQRMTYIELAKILSEDPELMNVEAMGTKKLVDYIRGAIHRSWGELLQARINELVKERDSKAELLAWVGKLLEENVDEEGKLTREILGWGKGTPVKVVEEEMLKQMGG